MAASDVTDKSLTESVRRLVKDNKGNPKGKSLSTTGGNRPSIPAVIGSSAPPEDNPAEEQQLVVDLVEFDRTTVEKVIEVPIGVSEVTVEVITKLSMRNRDGTVWKFEFENP